MHRPFGYKYFSAFAMIATPLIFNTHDAQKTVRGILLICQRHGASRRVPAAESAEWTGKAGRTASSCTGGGWLSDERSTATSIASVGLVGAAHAYESTRAEAPNALTPGASDCLDLRLGASERRQTIRNAKITGVAITLYTPHASVKNCQERARIAEIFAKNNSNQR